MIATGRLRPLAIIDACKLTVGKGGASGDVPGGASAGLGASAALGASAPAGPSCMTMGASVLPRGPSGIVELELEHAAAATPRHKISERMSGYRSARIRRGS